MTKRKSSGKPSAKSSTPKTSTSSGSGGSGRSRTKERRLERQRQRRQQQRFMIAAGVIGAVVLVIVLIILSTQPASAPIPDDAAERYAGIPQSVTEDGWYRLGRPDAPVRIEEFSSFACPGCADFNDNVMDGIIDIVVSGRASFTFIPQTNAGARASNAARAAICAGQQGMFFEYHDALFDWQRRYGNQAFSQNRLVTGAENLGLNTGTFESCLSGGGAEDIVDAAVAESVSRSIPGTPSTFVQGVEVSSSFDAINTQVNTVIAGGINTPIIPIDRDGSGGADVEATEEPSDAEATEEAEMTEEPSDAEATEEAEMTEEPSDAEATEEAEE